MDASPISTYLRRSIPEHDAYTVRVVDRRVAALATAHPADARRWICTTRWLHRALLCSGRLVVGLGVQWTPVRGRGDRQWTPPPATLQLCVGHRCVVLHLAQVDPEDVPAALYRFLADPRVVFVGYGSSHDRRMLWDHYGLHVEHGCDLRALTGMGNASVDLMARRFLGYHGISKPVNVSMSAWHAPRLSVEQVEYACVDAYLAFRLGLLLCSGGHQPVQRAPVPPRAPPPTPRAPVVVYAPRRAPVPELHRAPGTALVLHRAPPPPLRAPPRAPVLELHRAPGPARVFPLTPPPAPLALVPPRAPSTPAPRAPEPDPEVAVDGAESSSKIAETRAGFTGSDTEKEHGGLSLVRSNYAADDDGDLSSDGFEPLQRREACTDDDDEEENVYDYVARTGLVSDGDHGNDDEEGAYEDSVVGTGAPNAEDVGEQGDVYKVYAWIGILTVEDHTEEGSEEYTGILTVENEAAANDNEVLVNNGPVTVDFKEEGGLQLDGSRAPPEHFWQAECCGDSTGVFQGGEDNSSHDSGGDWYDQGDDGYVQDDDCYEPYDAFY